MTNAFREQIASIFGYMFAGILTVGAFRIALDIALRQKDLITRLIIILGATAITLIVIYVITGKIGSLATKPITTIQQPSPTPAKKTEPTLPTPPKNTTP